MTDTATALTAYCQEVADLISPLGLTLDHFTLDDDDGSYEGVEACRAALRHGHTPREMADDIAFHAGGFAAMAQVANVARSAR